MAFTSDLELADQVFQGCFERGEYEKALAAVLQCKNLSYRFFQSDHCTALDFVTYRDKWQYYRDMEREIRNLATKGRR